MPDDDLLADGSGTTDYAGAVGHYTSPGRRDAVKRRWEEPASVRLLDRTVGRVGTGAGGLRVLDVGCGTADGLRLLRSTPAVRERRSRGHPLRYVGLDLDGDLLEVARRAHADDAEATFLLGDIRDGTPAPETDLYLSSGVPYSHLTEAELTDAVARILSAARERPTPVAVIVDVLGRYSIEWTTRWSERRWSYRMSFFRGDEDAPVADMTGYGGDALRSLVAEAARRAGCALASLDCADRSIMVGRHTTTGEYTPGLRPYRDLVNGLYDPEVDVDLDALRFDLDLPPAPAEVERFFDDLAEGWNDLVDEACRRATGSDAVHAATVVQPELAERLRELEATRQRGLGVGHSLTAVAVTRPGS